VVIHRQPRETSLEQLTAVRGITPDIAEALKTQL
jgi:hypothetical protein